MVQLWKTIVSHKVATFFITIGSLAFLALFVAMMVGMAGMMNAPDVKAANLQAEFPKSQVASGDFAYNPVLTDVDGDGTAEMIVGNSIELSCYRYSDGQYQFARGIYARGTVDSGGIQGIQMEKPGVLLMTMPTAVYEIPLPQDACKP